MLYAFRGRCSFRVYIPNKPAKYGINVFSMVNARTSYVSNLEIYAGKQPEGPFAISNKTEDLVLRFCAPILGSGRNLTFDNWFTTIPLINKLLEEHKITVVGTI